MYLKQVTNDKTGWVSYRRYCASCGVGYVVDPLDDIEPYLKIAKVDSIIYTYF